jgi:hypothetical protein
MTETPKTTIEDARKYINLLNLDGGLVTSIGALSLGPNQTPDALNVFAYEADVRYRGGYSQFSTLAGSADADETYYDNAQIKHMLVWALGDIYDVASGAPVLIASGVYTPGEQIAKAELNGVLYWATLTVPLRQYDGITEMAVVGSAGVGVVAPPACNFLVAYAGSLVAVFPVVGGVPFPSAFMWSNVNDPSTWLGANIQTVGSNDGSACTFALLMGISPGSVANPGIPATRQLLIGKTTKNLFLYQGALGSLTENAVPCPVGTLDANSAVYIPTKKGMGAVMFLGSDAQFWITNGVEAQPAGDNVQNTVYALVQNALILNADQKFHATYNDRFQYYQCDLGSGYQFVYRWESEAWWLFQGWPSGPYMISPGNDGLPAIFVASQQPGITGVYQIALDQATDNGAMPPTYYYTPYIHGAKPERQKWFQTFTLFTYNVGVQYKVTGFSMPRSDNTTQVSTELIFNDPAVGAVTPLGAGGIWDVSEWDDALWGGGFNSLAQPYQPAAMHGRLKVPSQGTIWVPAGQPEPLKSSACQFKIEWSDGVADFRMIGISIGFVFRGTGFVGSLPFQTTGNVVPGGPSPYTNLGGSQ